MDDGDSFSDNYVPEDGKERKDGWEGGFAVDYEKRDMVDLETVGQVAYTGAPFVGVRYDDYFVATINEFAGELIDMGFDTARLGKEEVGDHGYVVGHYGGGV